MQEEKYARKQFEKEVRVMLAQNIPKSHIARKYNVPVYEIKKIQDGKIVDVVELYFYKKNKKIASKIYWEIYFGKGSVLLDEKLAVKYGVELWVAQELLNYFESDMNHTVVKNKE